MLQFIRPADPIFHAIVDEALTTAHLFVCETALTDNDIDSWRHRYPKTARCLTPSQAARAYADLLTAHRDARVWRYTDLQALILWEALFVFTALHTELVVQHPATPHHWRVGPFSLRTIDFHWIETLYFHHTDFLDEATFSILTPDLAAKLKFSPGTRRAALGLPATPDDLTMAPLDQTDASIWQHQALPALDPSTPITAYPVWQQGHRPNPEIAN
jgi:hypothetical protein